jgi:tetratricopeptide (TPR) repeat protein
MKKYIFIIILSLGFIKLSGQNVCSFSPEYNNTLYCLSGYSNYYDNINASVVVENILAKINLNNTYFVTKVCKGINNAVAIKYNGVAYILLDVDWMESIKYGNNDWFHLFVIGHEMAHHLLKHTEKENISLQVSRKNELEADEFAGYILGAYGASQSDINTLLTNFPDDNDQNSTHPQKKDRKIAINKGYNSSKNSETNLLIQTLTKDANFNLSNLPYLLTLARNKYYSFLSSNDQDVLNQAIEYYQQAIRFSKDPQIAYELGVLFMANGDNGKYVTALEFAYQNTNDEKYIIELLDNSISTNYNTDITISKFGKIADDINTQAIVDIPILISLSKYYRYMSYDKNKESSINNTYLQKAENLLKYSLGLIGKSNKMLQTDYYSRAEIYNELGLCNNINDNYEKSLEYFLKAQSDFEKGKEVGSKEQENIFCYYSNNILTAYCNLTLVYVRLREWDKGLLEANLYENTYNNLSEKKKAYITNTLSFNNQEIYYLKGRCFHGLKKYDEAIKNYSIEINNKKSKLRDGAVYYYRGLSYIGLGKSIEACSDFNYACNLGITQACMRFKTTCKQ